jgi:hypothetical protein
MEIFIYQRFIVVYIAIYMGLYIICIYNIYEIEILITFILHSFKDSFCFLISRAIHATRVKIFVFLPCYRNMGFFSSRPINARVLKRLFYEYT